MSTPTLKLLMVAYYYPPRGGGGVQRTVKFAKYLPEFGITPTVLTASVDVGKLHDESFGRDIASDVVRVPSHELHGIKARLAELFSFPDVYRSWIEAAVTRGVTLGRERKVDAVYSTAAPYTSHVVGMRIAAVLDVPWLADFRDLWTTNALYAWRTPWSRAMQRRYEKMFYARATHIIAASPSQRRCIVKKFGVLPNKVTTITNGFDDVDVQPAQSRTAPRNVQGPINITYLGSFYATYRPDDLVSALKLLQAANPALSQLLHLTFVGDHSRVARDLLGQPSLQKLVTLRNYVPHGELPKIHAASDAFMCYLPNRGGWIGASIPQKLYEYLAARKPILGILPPSDTVDIMQATHAGMVLPSGDIVAIAAGLLEFVRAVRAGTITASTADLTLYKRRTLTEQLATVVRNIVVAKELS